MTNDVVIVTDANSRKSLSAIRALGKSGCRVIAVGDSFFSTGFYSRFTGDRFISSTPLDLDYRVSKLFDSSSDEVCDPINVRPVLFIMEEATADKFYSNEEFYRNKFAIVMPPMSSYKKTRDKFVLSEFASSLGIPIPRTVSISTIDEFVQFFPHSASVDFLAQFIVKPKNSHGSIGVLFLDSCSGWQEACAKVIDLISEFGDLILQEKLAVPDYDDFPPIGVSILMDRKSRVIKIFQHARTKEYPIRGGASTQRKSVPLTDLAKLSVLLLQALSWEGVAMVEWRYDFTKHEYCLLEVNPRWWGSLELAIRAGVDFPVSYHEIAIGSSIDTSEYMYKQSKVCRWVWPGDLLRFLSTPKSERETLSEFFSGFFRDSEEYDKSDLRGFIASVLIPATYIFSRSKLRLLKRSK